MTENHLLPFPLGRTVITGKALERLHLGDVGTALQRHAGCDWGDLCRADKTVNDVSVNEGFRLVSAYRDRNHTRFFILTEADRSQTTIFVLEEC